ncbi:MAG: alcohol dehydrogenase catalytic domain-containing protein, partial [Candidatus Nanohaloarchaea archaeon]
MKALVTDKNKNTKIKEVNDFKGNNIVKTIKIGVDGTDKEVRENPNNRIPDSDDYIIMGHEAIGRVIKSDKFDKGDLVAPTVRRPTAGCKHCLNNRPDLCPPDHYVERGINGAHGFGSERFVERETEYLVKVPDILEDIGVLIEPLSIAEKGFNRAKNDLEDKNKDVSNALVLGAGSLGLLSSILLNS